MIVRVISGGQTGVDIAALKAAKKMGIQTGGTAPRGWLTLDGPRPEYADIFGMVECHRAGYAHRTLSNVMNSGATLRIASDFSTSGELCTLRACHAAERYPFDIGLDASLRTTMGRIRKAVEWIRERGPGLVLNVAGNTEQTAPGIELAAERILMCIFALANAPVRDVNQ